MISRERAQKGNHTDGDDRAKRAIGEGKAMDLDDFGGDAMCLAGLIRQFARGVPHGSHGINRVDE